MPGPEVTSSIVSIPWDGQRISRPGIYANIPLPHYHRGDICDGPSLSSSSLRLLWSKSPKHFWDKSPLNPLRDAGDDDNEDFVLGRAAHHLICGEIGFARLFTVRPDKLPDPGESAPRPWNGNRKACKDWLKLQKAAGKSVLTADQVEQIKGMAIAIGQHPFAGAAMSGLIERSIFWRDKETGVWLKIRPDCIPNASGDYSDLKSTRSVLYPDLQASLHNYGYWQQGALVLEGALESGLEVSSFSNVWVEKDRPHCVSVKPIDDEDIIRGSKANRVSIRRFHRCFTAKTWPGPGEDGDEAEPLRLSARTRESIDARLERELREAA